MTRWNGGKLPESLKITFDFERDLPEAEYIAYVFENPYKRGDEEARFQSGDAPLRAMKPVVGAMWVDWGIYDE